MVLLHKLQHMAFDTLINITLILYVIIAFGLSVNAPKYLVMLEYFLKIYVSLFLIWRFNPYRTVQFTNFDRKIAFNAGIFLLASMVVSLSVYGIEIFRDSFEWIADSVQFITL